MSTLKLRIAKRLLTAACKSLFFVAVLSTNLMKTLDSTLTEIEADLKEMA